MISIRSIKRFIKTEKYQYYTHALTEAKKDGVEPEDIVYVILTGKIIESYPDRQRVLVYGEMLNNLPLHVVCDYSDEDMIYITTVYIPSREEWSHNFQRRKRR
jgi:hypothetical protein